MKIVFLDSFTIQPKELNLDIFKNLGEFVHFDRTSEQQILERCQDADIILTNKVKINAQIMNQLPHLKYIGVVATGYNIVEVEAAKKRNIAVTNAKNYSSASVAQQVFAMILAFANRLSEHNNPQKWIDCPDFCYFDYPLTELSGKTLGLIGYGDIGKKVAQIALAFDMKVLVNKKNPFVEIPEGIAVSDLPTLLSTSDYISLHCPLTDENTGFINQESFQIMKPSSILINTARGPLINEIDLANALNSEKIAGAYLDVLSQEPPSLNQPLLNAKNCKISPHIAWGSFESRKRLLEIVYQNIVDYKNGKNTNRIV